MCGQMMWSGEHRTRAILPW